MIPTYEPNGIEDICPASTQGGACQPEIARLSCGVVHVRWPLNATLELPEALATISRIEKLTGDESSPLLLVDMRGMRYASSAVLRQFAQALSATRMALVGASPVEQTIGQFFQAIHRPSYPVSYFTQDSEALEWLAAVETTGSLTPPPQFPPAAHGQRQGPDAPQPLQG